jgi:hypothetical protein
MTTDTDAAPPRTGASPTLDLDAFPAPDATGSSAPGAARAREPEEWVASFAEGWRAPGGPDAFAAHFRHLLAVDVRLIQPQLPTLVGHEAFLESFARPIFTLMPDLRADVEHWAAREDRLYIELTLRGVLGRRSLSWRVCDRLTLRDGVATERESYFDPTPLLSALVRSPRIWPRFLRLQAARLSGGRR